MLRKVSTRREYSAFNRFSMEICHLQIKLWRRALRKASTRREYSAFNRFSMEICHLQIKLWRRALRKASTRREYSAFNRFSMEICHLQIKLWRRALRKVSTRREYSAFNRFSMEICLWNPPCFCEEERYEKSLRGESIALLIDFPWKSACEIPPCFRPPNCCFYGLWTVGTCLRPRKQNCFYGLWTSDGFEWSHEL